MRCCGQVAKEPEQQQQAAAKKKAFPRARKAGRAVSAPPGAEAVVVAEPADEVEIIDDDDADDRCATQVRCHQQKPVGNSLHWPRLLGKCYCGRSELSAPGKHGLQLPFSWACPGLPLAPTPSRRYCCLRCYECISIPRGSSHGKHQVLDWGRGCRRK